MNTAFAKALDMALGRLKSRERFSGDMRSWLIARGQDEAVADSVVEHLVKRGMLNDERAARALVKLREGKKAVGADKLRSEMLAKGANEDTVKSQLAELPDEAESAKDALRTKNSWTGRPQAGRFLAGRGFSEEAIESAREWAVPDEVIL